MTSSSATPEELDVEHRLVVYGTLAPGEPNEHVMADIPGRWTPAVVRGTRVDSGRGAAFGYPGLTLDDADDVNCVLFESAELPRHWPRLDHFEGPRYRRVVVEVRAEGRVVEAYVYELSGL